MTAAAIAAADRDGLGADYEQSRANSGIRSAIFDGLDLALDGRQGVSTRKMGFFAQITEKGD